MTNKATKYGIMIIAAVLLVGLVFAGAASAAQTVSTSDELVAAGLAGGNIVLTNDIILNQTVQVTQTLNLDGAGYTITANTSITWGVDTYNKYLFDVSHSWETLTIQNLTLQCEHVSRGINYYSVGGTFDARNKLTKVSIFNSTGSGLNLGKGSYVEASELTIDGSGYTMSVDLDSRAGSNTLNLTDTDAGLKDAIKVKDESAQNNREGNSYFILNGEDKTPNAYLNHHFNLGDYDYTGVAWVNETMVMAGLSENAALLKNESKLYLYKHLYDAINCLQDDDAEIVLLKDVSLGADGEIYVTFTPAYNYTLDLYGNSITADSGERMFLIDANKSFTLNDSSVAKSGKLIGSSTSLYGGAVYADVNSTFTMNGGSIVNSTGYEGGAVYVYLNAIFTMNGGSIVNCTATDGGAVYLQSSSSVFNMSDGSISYCTATDDGGAVYLNYGTFNMMDDASISYCSASNNGGGVYLDDGLLDMMDDASISYCSASNNGGGVYIAEDDFIMTGGSITNCNCGESGSGGGVMITSDCLFKVSGTVTIKDNTMGQTDSNNVYLRDDDALRLIGNIAGSIGIYYADGQPAAGELFGIAYDSYTGAENFFADNDEYLVGSLSDGDLVWKDITPTPKKHSTSKDMGSTVILTATQTPTPVVTATPTAAPTAVPTIATVKPTQQTSKSPAPFVGLIAGLGVAAVLLRLRK